MIKQFLVAITLFCSLNNLSGAEKQVSSMEKKALEGDFYALEALVAAEVDNDEKQENLINELTLRASGLDSRNPGLRLLIQEMKANLSYAGAENRETALHKAVKANAAKNTEYLCKYAGVDLNALASGDLSPLHLAAQYNAQESLQALLAYDDVDINLATAYNEGDASIGNAALHLAVYYGHSKIVALLVEVGADLFLKNGDNESPHDIALAQGHTDIANYLKSVADYLEAAKTSAILMGMRP